MDNHTTIVYLLNEQRIRMNIAFQSFRVYYKYWQSFRLNVFDYLKKKKKRFKLYPYRIWYPPPSLWWNCDTAAEASL